MHTLQSNLAADLWSYFSVICSIPHPSKHEQQLVNWIVNWASEKNINCVQDKIGNLILKKPATAGYENKTAVILQAHLDMVPQKNSDTEHDFLTDPIKTVINGEWMHAQNTTLGADNGIGLAACLAVLADNSLQHGPLEVLLTTDEETGMTGAFGLEADSLEGKILINTDSEQEGEIFVGCAGGININLDLPYEEMDLDPDSCAFEISLAGLKGGHSGCDINLGRANAIKSLASVLNNLDAIPFHIATFTGGSLRNAIPREANTVIVCNKQYQNSLQALINNLSLNLNNKFKDSENNLQLLIKTVELPASVLTAKTQNYLLSCLHDSENGVFSMDENFSDVVQTSSNLGVITQNKNNFNIKVLVRSQLESEKQEISRKMVDFFQKNGATVKLEGNYPGWTPNPNSAIYKVMEKQYSILFAAEAKTMVIHAGLECGLFSDKYPHWDMISFGPTIKFPHSPDEKVEIKSVDKFWQLLTATLAAID